MNLENKKGIFITFEGGEGSGKTTQARKLALALKTNVEFTREPGGTSIGEGIRDLFLSSDKITSMTELLLISAARAQHVNEVIIPSLNASKVVICDRFIDSTIAYQGFRGEISIDLICQLNQIATNGLKPDLTFILDLPPEIGLQRQYQKGIDRNRLDNESLNSHHKIRKGYLYVAEMDPQRVKLIDATQSSNDVHKNLLSEYVKYLEKRKYENKT